MPRLVVLENVPGFLTSHGGKDFRSALLALAQLGFYLDAFIIDAARFVPQSRQRLFVVGTRPSVSDIVHGTRKQPVFYESWMRPMALVNFILDNQDLPWDVRFFTEPLGARELLDNLIEDIPETSPEWWSEARVQYLLNQMSPRHAELANQMLLSDRLRYGTVFRRVRNGRSMAELRSDGTAGCLRTPKGGSGRQILFVAGRGCWRARLLTPRECARLMGADDYPITVPLNQALYGFGDAVCVPVIDWIARHYLNVVMEESRIRVPAGTLR